jgi:retron-type reverse transcriptase
MPVNAFHSFGSIRRKCRNMLESIFSVRYLLARIRHITGDEGFAINEKKTRVLKPAARQSVTGVVVNAMPSTSRHTRRQLRAILHNAGKTSLNAQNRSRRKNFAGWVSGMIGFVAMVNPRQAVRLREKFAAVRA